LNQTDHETQDEDEDIEFQDCAEEDEVVQEVNAEPQPTMTLAQKLHKTITEANITVDKDHLYHLSYFLKVGKDQFLDLEKLQEILSSFLKELERNINTTNLAEMHKEFQFIFEDYYKSKDNNNNNIIKNKKINKVHNNMSKPIDAPTENTMEEGANMFNTDKYSLKINLPLAEPPMELLQLVSTMLVKTFNSYDLNLMDQSFEENNTLVVLKTEFPPFIIKSKYDEIIKNLYSEYGEIMSCQLPQEKESKMAFNMKFYEQNKIIYTVLKLKSSVLPPKIHSISHTTGGKTHKIPIITYLSTAPTHCVYCRCTDHTTARCPMKPSCRRCYNPRHKVKEGEIPKNGHREIFCPKSSEAEQERLFNSLHPKTREIFFKKTLSRSLPMWALRIRNATVNDQVFYAPVTPRTSTTNGNGKRSRAQTSTNILNLDAAVVINNDKVDSDGFSIPSKPKNLSRSDSSSSMVSNVDNAVNPFQVLENVDDPEIPNEDENIHSDEEIEDMVVETKHAETTRSMPKTPTQPRNVRTLVKSSKQGKSVATGTLLDAKKIEMALERKEKLEKKKSQMDLDSQV